MSYFDDDIHYFAAAFRKNVQPKTNNTSNRNGCTYKMNNKQNLCYLFWCLCNLLFFLSFFSLNSVSAIRVFDIHGRCTLSYCQWQHITLLYYDEWNTLNSCFDISFVQPTNQLYLCYIHTHFCFIFQRAKHFKTIGALSKVTHAATHLSKSHNNSLVMLYIHMATSMER